MRASRHAGADGSVHVGRALEGPAQTADEVDRCAPFQQRGFGCNLQYLPWRAIGALALPLQFKSGQWLDIR